MAWFWGVITLLVLIIPECLRAILSQWALTSIYDDTIHTRGEHVAGQARVVVSISMGQTVTDSLCTRGTLWKRKWFKYLFIFFLYEGNYTNNMNKEGAFGYISFLICLENICFVLFSTDRITMHCIQGDSILGGIKLWSRRKL